MDEQQYWDCDICDERYPHNGGSQKHGDHSPIKRETANGEVLWLCGGCKALETSGSTNGEVG
jgi:hypothetical protein